MPKWMGGPCPNQTLLMQKWWTSLSPWDIIWCPGWSHVLGVHADQWGWETYILLRDNITSAHIGLSRIQRAENVVLYWAVMGPGETSVFFLFLFLSAREKWYWGTIGSVFSCWTEAEREAQNEAGKRGTQGEIMPALEVKWSVRLQFFS